MSDAAKKYGDYIVYVDESGDHSLTSINPDYPVFVLAFCVFKKSNYLKSTVQKIQQFKFDQFGHDIIVLHENEIRRDKGIFKHLKSKAVKAAFLSDLTEIIAQEDFKIIAAVIDKNKLSKKYIKPQNPYDIALRFCLERLHMCLGNGDIGKTHIVFEKRGRKEDNELELEFRRICDGDSFIDGQMNFEMVIADKQCNSAGLQLSDLVARPIGIRYLRPKQSNRAFDVIEKKFHNTDNGYLGIGMKVFP